MPTPAELPDTLTEFSFRNAASIDSGRNFDNDIERLMRSMDGIIEEREKIRAQEEAAALQGQAEKERKRVEAERIKIEAERAERKHREKEEREQRERAIQVAKQEQRRKRLEQAPQPWLLLLICGGAACLPIVLMLLFSKDRDYEAAVWTLVLAAITHALYGSAAGVLKWRGFGNQMALVLPVIPTLLLFFLIALPPQTYPVNKVTGEKFFFLVVLFVPAVICASLALWFYALWDRKRQA
jgi:hypothetical protein